jgi:hypothetical protein
MLLSVIFSMISNVIISNLFCDLTDIVSINGMTQTVMSNTLGCD